MDFPSVLRVAPKTLGRNKLRTALTLLGITIGIGAVICTVAIGQGGSNQIREQLLMLGDNFVWIEAGGRNVNGVRTGTAWCFRLPPAFSLDTTRRAGQLPWIRLRRFGMNRPLG